MERRSKEITTADANAPVEPLDQDLEGIIAELDAPFGHLPAEAIRAAQSNRDRIILRLMQLLDRVVQTIQQDEKRKTNEAFFALFLLIEFRAAEASTAETSVPTGPSRTYPTPCERSRPAAAAGAAKQRAARRTQRALSVR